MNSVCWDVQTKATPSIAKNGAIVIVNVSPSSFAWFELLCPKLGSVCWKVVVCICIAGISTDLVENPNSNVQMILMTIYFINV